MKGKKIRDSVQAQEPVEGASTSSLGITVKSITKNEESTQSANNPREKMNMNFGTK